MNFKIHEILFLLLFYTSIINLHAFTYSPFCCSFIFTYDMLSTWGLFPLTEEFPYGFFPLGVLSVNSLSFCFFWMLLFALSFLHIFTGYTFQVSFSFSALQRLHFIVFKCWIVCPKKICWCSICQYLRIWPFWGKSGFYRAIQVKVNFNVIWPEFL